MANLAIVGSHKVNGVAAVHSELIKTTIFKEFYEMFPTKFLNKTNGVTARRWVNQCNPGMAALFNEKLGGPKWQKNMDELKKLTH